MQAQRALPGITIAAVHFANHRLAAGFECDTGADGVAIRFRSDQFQLHPVTGALGNVVVEQRRLVGIGLIKIEAAIVIEVAHADSAAVLIVIHASVGGDFLESLSPQIAKHLFLLIAAPGHVTDVRPVVDVGEVDTRLGD